MNLERLIREAAKGGRLRHMTLAPSDGRWMGAVRTTANEGYVCAHDADPAAALGAVLRAVAAGLPSIDDLLGD